MKYSNWLICTIFLGLLEKVLLFLVEPDVKNGFKQELSAVGYRIGKVQSYKLLKESQKSKLWQIIAPQLDDNRNMKILNLTGNHYQIGFDYGYMLADQIQYTYNVLFQSQFDNKIMVKIVEAFMDWQYHSYVRKEIPIQFLNQMKGVRDGAFKARKIMNIHKLLQRFLVVSNFPADFEDDISAVFFDEFLRSMVGIKKQTALNYIQSNVIYVTTKIRQFIKNKRIMCSFFGVWGNRTLNGQLYTMRNLDWSANTGINLNKLIVIFNIDNSIPHAILGFPGLLGALTGISAKGITAHEAGQSSDLQSMQGFQWTLRMRYIMMKANDLNEAIKLWNSTKNTLGMNFMLGSSSDRKAVVVQTMRNYNALFYDNDPRQNRTVFTDHKGNKYVGGFSMPQAVFRTNHAYDPIIQKHSYIKQIAKDSDTMRRYFILRDTFNYYSDKKTKIGFSEAVNITAILGDKGSQEFYACKNNYHGNNVISVTYLPSQFRMWAAFQYGYKQNFRSASCGVYVQIDLKEWFGII